MLIGVPREIKEGERRVGLTPHAVRELVLHGHRVIVESGAGVGIGASDADYESAAAEITARSQDVWGEAELVVKVKEPQSSERKMLSEGQILFAYLHLAPDHEQTADLVATGAACIAYETVTDSRGSLPLLAPMSRVAGRLAVQAGAWALETAHGGAGVLIGGVPGVPPAGVVIIGGGVVGENAAEIAIGMGADVRVLDIDPAALDHLEQRFGAAVVTVTSTRAALESEVLDADLVIGAVLVTGARAPKLVTATMIEAMRPGSVVVDVAIDQGGCFETSHPTTHAEPTFVYGDIVHYCVANMPGAVPLTSTRALSDATLPRVLTLAEHGLGALRMDPYLRAGLNVYRGQITEPNVATAMGVPFVNPRSALAA
ncbi:alanine dehydrogenase [Candidatus Poriferisodalis sp.]|uniref:alanine dehydrogenase n=1 Tax=Candidatus Poriferisodalis sp. TaxID=3101277 RepID=UPI003B590AA8